jgi:predicted  nucleic acid-binding Zn-ribbon protein
VSDGVIPFEGRDVQCSNCGDTWFQAHPENEVTAAEADTSDASAEASDTDAPNSRLPPQDEAADAFVDDEPEAPEGTDTSLPPSARGMDPSVSDILREEAERESKIRETETGLESQPDLGLDDSDDEGERRARQARERMARIKGEKPSPVAEDPAGSRKGLLPDIEEINSSLRSGDKKEATQNVPADPTDLPPRPKKRGFTRGLALVLLIAVLLGFAYKMAPDIARTVPQADPMLSAYVALVDQARLWVDVQIGPLVKPYLNP